MKTLSNKSKNFNHRLKLSPSCLMAWSQVLWFPSWDFIFRCASLAESLPAAAGAPPPGDSHDASSRGYSILDTNACLPTRGSAGKGLQICGQWNKDWGQEACRQPGGEDVGTSFPHDWRSHIQQDHKEGSPHWWYHLFLISRRGREARTRAATSFFLQEVQIGSENK